MSLLTYLQDLAIPMSNVNPIAQRLLMKLALLIMPIYLTAQIEICDNAFDDDGDGMIDLNDEDCFCQFQMPESLIPNPSFEELDCCPAARTQLGCATDWVQASGPTTDLIHSCGWLGWEQFPPPLPFPDGDGIMGFRDGRVRGNNFQAEFNWKEYAGACLLNPLELGTTYRIEFDLGFSDRESSPPIDISFFGTTNCDFLPFGNGNPDLGCPTNGQNWVKLGEVRLSGGSGNVWVNSFIDITPTTDIHAIAIGPDCERTSSDQSTYYFFDNLVLADVESFGLDIVESEHPCSQNYTLSILDFADFSYQWYKDGIALIGENSAELSRLYGDGSYQVRTLQDDNCRLSEAFEYERPVFMTSESRSICDDENYPFGPRRLVESGMYIDTFRTVDNCDSIVMLDLEVIGSVFDTLPLQLFQGQTVNIGGNRLGGEGVFPVVLESSLGCDSLLMVEIAYSDVYIPNVFYPLSALGNDVFRPVIAEDLNGVVNMQIYDRFGGRVYVGTDWNGGDYPAGVYMYRIDVDFSPGNPETFFGSITLIR